MHATTSTSSRCRGPINRDFQAPSTTVGDLVTELNGLCDAEEEVAVVLEYMLLRRDIRLFAESEGTAIDEMQLIRSLPE